MARKNVLWITQTAMLLAIAVISQVYLLNLLGATTPIATLVVGSIVNLCLVLATLTCGFFSGASIGLCTPLIAFMVGKLAYPQQILIVALGNLSIVFIFWLFCRKKDDSKNNNINAFNWAVASIVGAFLKFIVLWLGMTKIFIEFVLKNDVSKPAPVIEKMTATLTLNFTWPQLATALVGCILAFSVYKVLSRVLYRGEMA